MPAMSIVSSRPLLASAVVAASLGIGWLGLAYGRGGPKPMEGVEKRVEKPTPLYFGAALCQECHKEPKDRNLRYLCRCNEYSIWEKEDKHRDAFNVLRGERAVRMGRIL